MVDLRSIGDTGVVRTAVLAVAAPLALIAVAAAIAGLGTVIFNTLWETTLQQQVPARARARVSS
jgi:hypothetical protein